MKLLNKTLISTAAALTVLFSGCGETTTDNSASSIVADDNIVTVERGPILGALVLDAKKNKAKDLGDGRYEFNTSIDYPIEVVGGYIDVNRNGSIDSGEVKNTVVLKAGSGKSVTLVSTLATDTEMRVMMEENFGLTLKDIETKLPSNNTEVEALSNEIYAMMIDQGIEDIEKIKLKLKEEGTVLEIKTKITEYEEDGRTVGEREEALIESLLNAPVISDLEVEEIELKLQERHDGRENDILEYLHDINLSAEQEVALQNAYLLQDVALEFLNDADIDAETKAEVEQKTLEAKEKLEALLTRYEIAIPTEMTAEMTAAVATLKAAILASSDRTEIRTMIENYLKTQFEAVIESMPESLRITFDHEMEMKMEMENEMENADDSDDSDDSDDEMNTTMEMEVEMEMTMLNGAS